MLSAREHPAVLSGMSTFLWGDMIEAVSAIKWTPQNTMMSAVVFPASCDNPNESPM